MDALMHACLTYSAVFCVMFSRYSFTQRATFKRTTPNKSALYDCKRRTLLNLRRTTTKEQKTKNNRTVIFMVHSYVSLRGGFPVSGRLSVNGFPSESR